MEQTSVIKFCVTLFGKNSNVAWFLSSVLYCKQFNSIWWIPQQFKTDCSNPLRLMEHHCTLTLQFLTNQNRVSVTSVFGILWTVINREWLKTVMHESCYFDRLLNFNIGVKYQIVFVDYIFQLQSSFEFWGTFKVKALSFLS